MGQHPSQLAAAADAVLATKGTTLVAWLTEATRQRKPLRTMARELTDTVGFDVSRESIRRWLAHYREAGDLAEAVAS